MRPGNRYAREAGVGRTLGELVRAQDGAGSRLSALQAQARALSRQSHPRYGEDFPAIELRKHLRCSGCRGRVANLHEVLALALIASSSSLLAAPASDKSSTIARLDDLPAGGGAAALLDAWWLGDLDGKPEGLTFTAQGRAIVGPDTRKSRRNLVLLEPAVA